MLLYVTSSLLSSFGAGLIGFTAVLSIYDIGLECYDFEALVKFIELLGENSFRVLSLDRGEQVPQLFYVQFNLLYRTFHSSFNNDGAYCHRLYTGYMQHLACQWGFGLSLIHICRCRRLLTCRSRWSPYH
eukprot:TRINITY_DN12748_c0_g2_i8.p1 TRINITY_DN12748_c0_g2~~TRINITY_DN12748_c0_g2_i8.p1  ORF type:complete len:130 (+),score=3.53 TRINITY_DN12748_c0_g2_i8:149-538(+)